MTRRNVAGLENADTRIAIVPGGSNLSWLIGHLVTSRDGMLRLLDARPMWTEAQRWHETYHQGRMALYRRIAGHDGAIRAARVGP